MNPTPRTPKSVYMTLIAGFVVGAVSMAGIGNGLAVNQAQAQTTGNLSGGFAQRLISTGTAESVAELHNLDSSFANLADFVGPAVVHIRAVTEQAVGANGMRQPMRGGQGSGFIYRPDGYILTNDHVVGSFDKVTVITKDGREYPGKVTRAEDSDLAIVKIEATNLPTLAFADSSKVRPGQFAMAIGAPFGLENSVTVGHVSALGRSDLINDKLYPDLIQTDTSINMGNSGGPLVNIDGQVIGINTAILSPTGTSAGIGFAIPANQARFIADILTRDGKITRSMIQIIPEDLKEYEKVDLGLKGGARVVQAPSNGPAAIAGIKDGDIITRINEMPINGQLDLRNAMLQFKPGTTVAIEAMRGKERKTFQVKLIPWVKPTEPTAPRGRFQGPGGGDGQPMPEEMEKFFRGNPELRDMFPQMPNQPDDENVRVVPPVTDGKPRLGVSVEDLSPSMRKQFNVPTSISGAVVSSVQPGSVANRLGLRVGDIVTQLGDRKVTKAQDLIDAMKDVKAGDKRRLSFSRYTENGQVSMSSDVTFK